MSLCYPYAPESARSETTHDPETDSAFTDLSGLVSGLSSTFLANLEPLTPTDGCTTRSDSSSDTTAETDVSYVHTAGPLSSTAALEPGHNPDAASVAATSTTDVSATTVMLSSSMPILDVPTRPTAELGALMSEPELYKYFDAGGLVQEVDYWRNMCLQLKTERDIAQSELTRANSTVAQLRAESDRANSAVARLQAESAVAARVHEREIARLHATQAEYTDAVERLKDALIAKDAKLEANRLDSEAQKQQLAQTSATSKALEAERDARKAQMDALITEKDAVTLERDTARREAANVLNEQVESAKKKQADLQEDLDWYKEEKRKLGEMVTEYRQAWRHCKCETYVGGN